MKHCQNKSNIEIVKSYLEGTRPFTTVGYQPPVEEQHKDGDVWTDKDGKEWVQKGSTKMSNNLFITQKAIKQICPVCKKDIFWGGNNYDEKFFNKTGKCYDCVIEEEHKMRIDGTFGIYEKIKVIKNQQSFLKELKTKIEESLDYVKKNSNKIEYINEDGTLERWSSTNKDHFITEAEIDLKEVNKSLILCAESIKMLEEQFNELKSTQSATVS